MDIYAASDGALFHVTKRLEEYTSYVPLSLRRAVLSVVLGTSRGTNGIRVQDLEQNVASIAGIDDANVLLFGENGSPIKVEDLVGEGHPSGNGDEAEVSVRG
jgi:hypothetical protein